MNDLIKKGKKIFTVTVVLTTIAWSIGLGALALPLVANATELASGDLIKGTGTAVYYYGADAKRYLFPYQASYSSWYTGFGTVQTLTDAELIAIPYGGNVTAKPGKLAQVVSTDTPWTVMDPKVYAIGQGGVLHWVKTAALAVEIFGSNWGSQIVAVPESLLTNFTIGSEINAAADYSLTTQQAVASINVDKGLTTGGTTPVEGALTVALATDTPAGASVPKSAADVSFTKVNFTAGAEDVSITGLKVTRTGLGIDSNLSSLKLFVNGVQKGTSQTLGSTHKSTFTLSTSPINVPANSTVAVVLAADIAAATAYDQHVLGIADATDVTTTATVGGTFPVNGNVMSLANVTIGTATIDGGALNPGDTSGDTGVDPAAIDFRFSQVKISAGATEAITVSQLTAIKNGTAANTDVKNIELYNDTTGASLGEVASLDANGKAVFSNLNLVIAKGGYVELSIRADMNGGSSRTIGFDIHDGTAFAGLIRGNTYGSGITPSFTGTTAFCDVGAGDYTCQRQTINQGYLAVSKSASAPATGNVAVGGSGVKLMAFDFVVAGESINVSSTVVKYTTATATADEFTNWTLYKADGSILAGPKNGDDTDAGEEILTFTDAYTLPVGTTVVYVKADISTATSASDTVYVHMAASAITAKGAESGKTTYTTSSGTTVPPSATITGNTMTLQGAVLTITTAASPVAGSVVVNAQDQIYAYFDLDASAGGEDVRVSAITVTDTDGAGTGCTSDLNNLELWGDPDTTDATAQNIRLETSNSTTTMTDAGSTATQAFTFKTPIVIGKTAASRLTLKADVLAATCTSDKFNVNAGGDVTAIGKSTGNAATKTVSGAGQVQTVQTSGNLKVEKAADMPVAAQLVSASTGNEVMKYKFTTRYEAIDVTTIGLFCGNNGQAGTECTRANVARIYVYADGTLIGNTAGYTLNATGNASVVLDSGTLVIPKDSYKTITLKIDLPAKTEVTTSSAADLQIGIEAAVSDGATQNEDNTWGDAAGDQDYWIVATGQQSGATISKDTINSAWSATSGQVFGSNGMSAHKGVLTASLNASSPSGTQTAGANKEAMRFNLTATGDDVELNELELCLGGTATNAANTPTGTLYLKSSDLATTYGDITMTLTTDYDAYWTAVVGVGDYYFTADGTAGTKCVSFGDNATGDGVVQNVAGSPMEAFDTIPSIAAGTTKTFSLMMDTTGITTNETLQVTIGPNSNSSYDVTTSGIDYEDSSGTNIDLATTKNLPVSGGTLAY